MGSDETFRMVLLAGFVAVLPFGVYHRVKSQSTGEKLDRLQEGLFILIAVRLMGAAAILSMIAYLVNPGSMKWSSIALPDQVRWTGAVLGVIGGGLTIWTFRSLGKNLTDTVVTRKAHTLVTSGPYRWVRHPFYLSGALLVIAGSLITANWFPALAGSIAIALLVIRTDKEEANLIARFGEDYREYMNRTGRFVPRVTRT
jgi:protein-S-isoprenylcysteine O-methyltransferase Ste14